MLISVSFLPSFLSLISRLFTILRHSFLPSFLPSFGLFFIHLQSISIYNYLVSLFFQTHFHLLSLFPCFESSFFPHSLNFLHHFFIILVFPFLKHLFFYLSLIHYLFVFIAFPFSFTFSLPHLVHFPDLPHLASPCSWWREARQGRQTGK